MLSIRRRLVHSFLLTALALGVTSGPSFAQEDSEQDPPRGEVHSWAVAPTGSDDPSAPGNRPHFSYDAAPGTTIDDSVTVFNFGNVPLTFRVYATDAFNNADGEFSVLAGHEVPVDVGGWVSMPQANVTVMPGQQVRMPIKIAIPANATPGDHVGAVMASSQVGGSSPDGKVVTLDRRTGTRIYMRVAGPLTPDLAVENVKVRYDPSLNPLGGTATVKYRIENRGNIRLNGKERVTVSGPFGLFAKASPEADLPELLPGDGFERTVTLKGVAATGLLSADIRVEPGAAVAGDPAGDRSRSTLRTLALPYTLLAIVLVALLVRYARRSYTRHEQQPVTVQAPAA